MDMEVIQQLLMAKAFLGLRRNLLSFQEQVQMDFIICLIADR